MKIRFIPICSVLLSGTILSALPLVMAVAYPFASRFRLGRVEGKQVEGIVDIRPQEEAPSDAVTVHVHYKVGANRTNVLSASESYIDKVRTGAYQFTKADHKQLFVTTRLGRVCSYVYELSGNKIHTIYSLENGRVVVTPKRNSSGRYDLEEQWPKLQWEDVPNLGEGKYNPKLNYVSRLLYWNGKKFVPYHPGPSTIK